MAKEAGLLLGTKESIVVNEKMETSVPDIYAVGDAVEVKHFVTGEKRSLRWQGRPISRGALQRTIYAEETALSAVPKGHLFLSFFDMTIASTGINEKMAKAENIAYDKVITFSASHATYYPGASGYDGKDVV